MSLILFPRRHRSHSDAMREKAGVLKQLASAKRFESFSHIKTCLELLTSEAAGSGDYALVCAVDDWVTTFANELSKKRAALSDVEDER